MDSRHLGSWRVRLVLAQLTTPGWADAVAVAGAAQSALVLVPARPALRRRCHDSARGLVACYLHAATLIELLFKQKAAEFSEVP
jgi:hypothetical protein